MKKVGTAMVLDDEAAELQGSSEPQHAFGRVRFVGFYFEPWIACLELVCGQEPSKQVEKRQERAICPKP